MYPKLLINCIVQILTINIVLVVCVHIAHNKIICNTPAIYVIRIYLSEIAQNHLRNDEKKKKTAANIIYRKFTLDQNVI